MPASYPNLKVAALIDGIISIDGTWTAEDFAALAVAAKAKALCAATGHAVRRQGLVLTVQSAEEVERSWNTLDVTTYFEALGFDVAIKFGAGGRWHEVFDEDDAGNGKLLIQIDCGIPLADILEDLPLLAAGREGTSKSNFVVNGSDDALKHIAAKMKEHR